MTDDHGIIYDSHREHGESRWNPMGIAVFDSFESRAAAMEALKEMGFRYMVTYKDTQGPGLSWCYRPGWPEYTIRPARRERLRHTGSRRAQKAQADAAWARAHGAFQRSLYRNPAYDLVNEPRTEPRYA